MIEPSNPSSSGAGTTDVDHEEVFRIDESVRLPALLFVGSAVAWLLAGTVLSLIVSFKLHTPGFLAGTEWLTYGRVRAASHSVFVYGWGFNAAIAVAMWIMARLSHSELRHGGILNIAGMFWNLGVLVGTIGILFGHMEAAEWLEFPRYVTPWLFFSWLLISVWAVVIFRYRAVRHTFVSQWYILAAIFCFPWLYAAAQIVVIWWPAIGVIQPIAAWWYAHNVYALWFTPIGLAAAYYFIPKVIGRPIRSYHLSVIGFWSLITVFSWAGPAHLIGGPVPVWVQSTGTVAWILTIIPVVVIGINLHLTTVGSFGTVWNSPTLRFVVFGAINFTLVTLIGVLVSLRGVNALTQFTHFSTAHAQHGLYAFFTMVMFGAIYFMLPRLLHKEWPSSWLMGVHFWGTAAGIAIYIAALTIGGLVQGGAMQDPAAGRDFLPVVSATIPWLFTASAAGIVLLTGHVAFAVNVTWMIFKRRSEAEVAPTLFSTPQELGTSTT